MSILGKKLNGLGKLLLAVELKCELANFHQQNMATQQIVSWSRDWPPTDSPVRHEICVA